VATRDLNQASPEIRGVFQVVKTIFERKFRLFEIRSTCVYRSPEEQQVEYLAKRSNCDGIRVKSKHNTVPTTAIDFGIFRRTDGAYLDDLVSKAQFPKELRDALYWVAGLLAQRNGARWGGDWDGDGIPVDVDDSERLNDPYHIEVPA
jgi:hypothetical protein